jgi:hypothetical protein
MSRHSGAFSQASQVDHGEHQKVKKKANPATRVIAA